MEPDPSQVCAMTEQELMSTSWNLKVPFKSQKNLFHYKNGQMSEQLPREIVDLETSRVVQHQLPSTILWSCDKDE